LHGKKITLLYYNFFVIVHFFILFKTFIDINNINSKGSSDLVD